MRKLLAKNYFCDVTQITVTGQEWTL